MSNYQRVSSSSDSTSWIGDTFDPSEVLQELYFRKAAELSPESAQAVGAFRMMRLHDGSNWPNGERTKFGI